MIGMRRVTARVDADSRVGLGHFRRAGTLLEELARRGCSVGFVGRIEDGIADRATIEVVRLPALGSARFDQVRDAEDSLAAIEPPGDGGSWIVLDHYGLDEPWERKVAEAGHRILALDDLRDRAHCAEILVSDTPERFASELDLFPGGALQLVGEPYVLLGPEFSAVEKTLPSSSTGLRLLVTFGGADPTRETFKVLQALREHPEGLKDALGIGVIDLIVGPACESSAELARLAGSLADVELHVAPPSLAPFFYSADLVLTSGGNSLVEALAVGRPCLVVETAANQSRMVRSLREEGVVLALGDHREVSPAAILRGLEDLASVRLELAARLSERPVFDTRGAGRIARAMETRSASRTPGSPAAGAAEIG